MTLRSLAQPADQILAEEPPPLGRISDIGMLGGVAGRRLNVPVPPRARAPARSASRCRSSVWSSVETRA